MKRELVESKIVLLLTGTIVPQFKVTVSDPETRLKEYIKSVQWYLDNTPYKVVFCENSGYTSFCEQLREAGANLERFEYITFKPKAMIGGPGYMEWEILREIKNKSLFIDDATFFVKGTGRLILTNIKSVMNQFSSCRDSFFAGEFARDFQSMTTTFFAFTPDLYEDLLSIQDEIVKKYVEISIIKFVHKQFKKDPESIILFNRPLLISGRSGHYGHIYDTPSWKIPIRYLRRVQRLLEWHLITIPKYRKIMMHEKIIENG